MSYRFTSLIGVALLGAALFAAPAHAQSDEEIREHADALFDALEEEEAKHGKVPAPAPEAPQAPAAPAPAPAAPQGPPPEEPALAPPAAIAPPPIAAAPSSDAEDELAEFARLVRARRHRHHHRHPHFAVEVHGRVSRAPCADDGDDDDEDEDNCEERDESAGDPPEVEDEIEIDAPSTGARYRLRLGVEAHGAVGPFVLRDDGNQITGGGFDDLSVTGLGGFDVALRLFSNVRLGVGQIAVLRGESDGRATWAGTLAPYGELFFGWGRFVEGYAQGGVALQMALDGSPRAEKFGVAPYLGLGLRLTFGRFSFGPGARAFYVASDHLITAGNVLPEHTVMFTGGFDAHVHF